MRSSALRWWRGATALVRRQSVSQEIDAEIASHIAYATDDFVARGFSVPEARRRALVEFGGVQQTREWVLRERALSWCYDAARDSRLALRRIRHEPTSSLAIVLVVAIGIACVTSVFSVVNAAWLRPLPYNNPAALVQLYGVAPTRYRGPELPLAMLSELRQRVRGVAELAAFTESQTTARLNDTTVSVHRTRIDAGTLLVLRVTPTLGRAPTAAEYRDQASVALISDSLWRTDFAARGDVLSADIKIAGVAHRVIGVMPKDFYFHTRAVLWTPLSTDDRAADSARIATGDVLNQPLVQVLARLRDGMTRDSLDKRIDLAAARSMKPTPTDTTQWRIVLDDVHERGQNAAGYSIAAVAFLVTAIVLIVACANVMNILLARGSSRRREMAVAAALGASSFRLVRQLLVECLVLALAAGALGVALSALGLRLMLAAVPRKGFPGWIDFTMDWRVLSFALAVAILTMLLFGLLPAREASRVDPLRAIQDGDSLGITARQNKRWSARLISVQLALSLVLVVVSGLLVASYRSYLSVVPAYPAERMTEVFAMLDESRKSDFEYQHAHTMSLAAALRADPTIAAISSHSSVRYLREDATSAPVRLPQVFGLFAADDSARALWRPRGMWPDFLAVDARYFSMHRRRLLSGRDFNADDTAGALLAIVVSEGIARATWGNDTPVGRQVRLGAAGPIATVIGVAEDVQRLRFSNGRLTNIAEPQFFFALAQTEPANTSITIEARQAADSAALALAVRAQSKALDPNMRVAEMRTLAEQSRNALLPLRLLASVLTVVAALTLGIAAVGLFGLVYYATVQRRREIGIRLALGASPHGLERSLLRESLRNTRAGLLSGAILIVLLLSVMWSRFPISAIVLLKASLATGIVLIGVVAIACWLPVRHAARMDPSEVLRRI